MSSHSHSLHAHAQAIDVASSGSGQGGDWKLMGTVILDEYVKEAREALDAISEEDGEYSEQDVHALAEQIQESRRKSQPTITISSALKTTLQHYMPHIVSQTLRAPIITQITDA